MGKNIIILATTDVHGNIWGYNYENNEEMKEGGMAQLFTYIQEVRCKNPYVILLDNGDMVQGTLLTDEIYNRKYTGEHPLARVMNFMGYDAMNLGNHEFNLNLSFLEEFNKQLEFPLLSANTIYKNTEKTLVNPYTIIERDNIKIGVLGLVTPMVPIWVGNKVEDLKFSSLSESAKKYIEVLKNQVDIIVVLAHCSLEGEGECHEDSAIKILEVCPEVDVLVVGHFHITVEDRINRTIIGGATDKGREIIRFDLEVDENNKVINKNIKIISMNDFEPSKEIRAIPLIREAHNKTINLAHGKILGRALRDFQPPNEINWIPQGRLEETPLINLINKVQLINSKADISATSLIKENSNIYRGNITYGTICNIYKFDTKLFLVELTGSELKRYMEWNASAYNKFNKGDISISFSTKIPNYQHDIFSGIDYNIDLSKEEGRRIVDLKFKGRDLKDNELVKIAISDYCYYSTLRGRGFTEREPLWKSSKFIKEMIAEYISKKRILEPELNNNWRLVGYDIRHPKRKEIIQKVNEGVVDIPYNKSLNIFELKSSDIL